MTLSKPADTSAALHPLLAQRWSPRGFDQVHELDDERLTTLLEAARWASSAANTQPWRFLVTRRGEVAFKRLFGTLAPGNQTWAGGASALVLVAARTVAENGDELPWALYDTGQAVASLVVQAQADGLAVHQMGGFDRAAVAAEFCLDAGLTPLVVVAVGRADHTVDLPTPLAERERAPRARHPLGTLLLPAEARSAA
ncbi:nitroreductase family protein [Micromonospora zhanjiangensis]|uniref:Nitroreductase family protein n=1 Tax=Micromonospora zhanjiangensis TaxID=1522057 RepID=A0ABV8KN07_9ACTN